MRVQGPSSSSGFAGLGAVAALVAACVALLAGLLAWFTSVPVMPLRDRLALAQRPALDILLVVALSSLALCAPAAARWLRAEVGLRGLHVLAIALLAALATLAIPPRTNRIFYDEQIYQSVAHNMSDLGLAQMCNDGSVEFGRLQCARAEYNKQPYGYPHVLSVLYRAFGARERLAHAWNLLATTLLSVAVLVLAAALWSDVRAGLFAGAFVATFPQQLLWSRTAASEPSAALFCTLAVLAWLAFTRLRSPASLVCAVAFTAWAFQFRPESVLLVPVLAVYLAVTSPDEFLRPRFWAAALLGIALCAVLVGHMVAVRNEGWGTTGDRLSAAYFLPNLQVNGWFYLRDPRFPWVATLLAGAGLLGASRHWRQALLAASWFLAFFLVYLFFYAGSYNYGADVRYSLLTYPPLAVLAGRGATLSADLLHRLVPRSPRSATIAVAALLAFHGIGYLPVARAVGEEAWAAREDVAYAREIAARLPPDSLVLTHNPNMFLLWGRNAAQASIAATEPDYVRTVYLPRHRGGVYFHWNFWCNVNDPVQHQFCVDILDRYNTRTVESRTVRDQHFVLYQLLSLR